MTIPPITKKQQAILQLIYQFRFLNRIQIQAFLHHASPRRINAWLPDLVAKGYLHRIYSTDFAERIKPAVYYLGLNGIRFLSTEGVAIPKVVKRIRQEPNRSDTFIQQCLSLADICLACHGDTSNQAKRRKTSFQYETLSDMADEMSTWHFLSGIRPTAVLVSERDKNRVYLLELFEPTLPRYSIRKRIRTYIELFTEGDWEVGTDLPLPTILLVCPTKPFLISAKRYVKKLKAEDRLPDEAVLWFGIEEEVRKHGIGSEVWEEVN